jgi:hypothetical protein
MADVSAGELAPAPTRVGGTVDVFNRIGVYFYVPDPGQAPIIAAAVNRAVAHMFFIARGFARDRLMSTNKLPDTLRVIVEPDTLGTQTDRDKPMNLPRSGTAIRWDDGTGNLCRARDSVAADTLFQFCNVGKNASVARYVLIDGGGRLRMIIHITSPHLSGPVDYAIDFRRCD